MTEEYRRRSYDQHLENLINEVRNNISALQTSNALLTEIVRRHDAKMLIMTDNMFGKDGNNGIIGRLNSLERYRARQQRHINYLWTVFVTWLSGVAAYFFTKGS